MECGLRPTSVRRDTPLAVGRRDLSVPASSAVPCARRPVSGFPPTDFTVADRVRAAAHVVRVTPRLIARRLRRRCASMPPEVCKAPGDQVVDSALVEPLEATRPCVADRAEVGILAVTNVADDIDERHTSDLDGRRSLGEAHSLHTQTSRHAASASTQQEAGRRCGLWLTVFGPLGRGLTRLCACSAAFRKSCSGGTVLIEHEWGCDAARRRGVGMEFVQPLRGWIGSRERRPRHSMKEHLDSGRLMIS
jgi:hypothetical protein